MIRLRKFAILLLLEFGSSFYCILQAGHRSDTVAASPGRTGKVLSFTRPDSLSSDIQYYLKEYRTMYFEDPTIPRFLIHDRNDHFVFGVGGYVAAYTYYDNAGVDNIGFSVPDADVKERSGIMRMNMGASRLSFFLLGRTKRDNIINAYIETDFCGESKNLLRLRQAYVDFFGFRIGQTWTSFYDEVTMNLIDFNCEFTSSQRRFPVVAYKKIFKNGITFKGAFEFPLSTTITVPVFDTTGSVTGTSIVTSSLDLPDLTLNVLYNRDRLHLYAGLNSRITNFWAQGAKTGKEYSYLDFNWAAQVSGNVAFVKRESQIHKFFFQGIYTQGMNDCVQIFTDKGMSLILDKDYNKYIPSTWGMALGYQATWGRTMANNVNFSFSYADIFGNKAGYDNMVDSGLLVVINYVRSVFTYGTVGVEALWGKNSYVGVPDNSNFRVYLLLRYNF